MAFTIYETGIGKMEGYYTITSFKIRGRSGAGTMKGSKYDQPVYFHSIIIVPKLLSTEILI